MVNHHDIFKSYGVPKYDHRANFSRKSEPSTLFTERKPASLSRDLRRAAIENRAWHGEITRSAYTGITKYAGNNKRGLTERALCACVWNYAYTESWNLTGSKLWTSIPICAYSARVERVTSEQIASFCREQPALIKKREKNVRVKWALFPWTVTYTRYYCACPLQQ